MEKREKSLIRTLSLSLHHKFPNLGNWFEERIRLNRYQDNPIRARAEEHGLLN